MIGVTVVQPVNRETISDAIGDDIVIKKGLSH